MHDRLKALLLRSVGIVIRMAPESLSIQIRLRLEEFPRFAVLCTDPELLIIKQVLVHELALAALVLARPCDVGKGEEKDVLSTEMYTRSSRCFPPILSKQDLTLPLIKQSLAEDFFEQSG